MAPILVPAESPEDWRRLLARPDRHWRAGYSAMTLAQAWEEARGGFPPEVRAMLDASNSFKSIEPLLIIPEYKVPLPGGRRESQTDVFVLARHGPGLVAIAVEGKVDEPFGPTVEERRAEGAAGVEERLRAIYDCLGVTDVPGSIRYQLLHRTASAVLAARQYFATDAVMLVHSFSPSRRSFDDFTAFAELFGVKPNVGDIVRATECSGVRLSLGWCSGDLRFLGELTPAESATT